MFDVLALLAVSLLLFAFAQFGLTYVSEENKETAASWIEISLCFVLLTLAFCSYGVVQEYIMTMDYNGERFPSTAFLIFSNRVFVILFASVALVARGKAAWTGPAGTCPPGPSWCAAIPALTVFLASFCQYESLLYIIYPTQVVFKSCKIVPTMILSTVMNATTHSYGDYIYAVIITSCVAGFTVASETRESENLGPSYIGILMMITFLLADALTSNTEKKIFNAWKDPEFDNVQMMFAVGFWTLTFSGVTVVSTVSFGTMLVFFGLNPAAVGHVIGLSVCSAGGQFLIFYIIKYHGPVVFSIMMTVRQMFSIVISTVLFGHEMGMVQIGCAAICFITMILKPLIKQYYKADKKAELKPAATLLPGESMKLR
jgi:adenosine 3'-phospho 5'-phosphosulfate transporter B2